MGLFDLFKPKTVEGRYKTLLKLFRHVHKTFTITKNEKCIIEFTYGIDNENKQYWSIEQPFDRESVCINGISFYDPSKKVTISMHTTVEGYPVKTSKTFDQSTNQIVMFNTIMQSSIEEIAKAADSLYGDEIKKRNSRRKNKSLNSNFNTSLHQFPLSSEEERMLRILTQKMKEKGLSVNEDKFREEYNKLNNEVYDGSKDYEINTLTITQKVGLLGAVVSLCTYTELTCKDGILRTIFDLSDLLNLSRDCCNDVINRQSTHDIERYIHEVKTIEKDGPFIQFIYTCTDIIDLLDSTTYIKSKFNTLLKDIGFSSDDIEAISHGRYNYRFNNDNIDEIKDSNSSKSEDSKAKVIQTWSLIDFARNHGKMQIGTFHQEEFNIIYKACIFTLNSERTYVYFSSELGELTPQEIVNRKNQLKVAKLSNGTYELYE